MPRPAVQQDASWRSATGSRVQLNMFIDDKIEEVKHYTFTPMSGINIKTGRYKAAEAETLRQQEAATMVETIAAPKTTKFVPQYMEEGQFIESRETSYKVNNRRTPSGNFFQTSNPAIYQDLKEQRFEGQETVSTDALIATGKMSGTKARGSGGLHASISSIPEAVATGESASATAQNATSTWLLPHQTGVRNVDIAKQVGSKRTPNGAFALHGLPVYGRS